MVPTPTDEPTSDLTNSVPLIIESPVSLRVLPSNCKFCSPFNSPAVPVAVTM